MTGLTIHHPPAGHRRWHVQSGVWIATVDALWHLGDEHRIVPLPHVTALAADASKTLVRSEGRQRLVGAPDHPLTRRGLDATAVWDDGWHIEGLPLPYGGRRAPDLCPTVRGLGATWSTAGQHVVADVHGVRAVRAPTEAWDVCEVLDEVDDFAVAGAKACVWGPDESFWDLSTGERTPLPEWFDGLACAQGSTCVVVDALDGQGAWYDRAQQTARFTLPLRNDGVEAVHLSDGTATVVTTLGKRFTVHGTQVQRLAGRELAEPREPLRIEALGLRVDGQSRTENRAIAWRRDGALVSWTAPRR